MQENLHSVVIEQRKGIVVSGVQGVKSFCEGKIELILTDGKTKLTILGSSLKITGFSKSNGSFSGSGKVDAVRYGGGLKIFQ